MNKIITITTLSLSCFLAIQTLKAQDLQQDYKYRRSSLTMVLIESESFPNKEAVMGSWNNFPFPDKYNKHEVDLKSFNADAIQLTDQDLMSAGFLLDTLSGIVKITKATASLKEVRYVNAENTLAVVMPSEKQEYQLKIDKIMREKKLANKLVASWFNRSADGKFDMSVIQERGFYNASEMEASIAQGQTRGMASLGDAGEELIRNSFVTFSKFNFVENEPVARAVYDVAKETIATSLAGSPQIMIDKAMKGAEAVYNKTKEGYSLWSKTWLYRLNWNDSIEAIFYTDLWNNPIAFDESDLFSLEYVGVQYNQSLVTFKLGEKRTEEQIIDIAMVRNVDRAFVQLQKENEVFKPKAPVLSSNPITAQIGMKEGLKGGEVFDVLEMVFNKKTGKTEYKTVGSVTADKTIIWDNRYNVGDSDAPKLDKAGNPITATLFKGGKSVQPGMLLKQKK